MKSIIEKHIRLNEGLQRKSVNKSIFQIHHAKAEQHQGIRNSKSVAKNRRAIFGNDKKWDAHCVSVPGHSKIEKIRIGGAANG
jgi:hypothetical protein